MTTNTPARIKRTELPSQPIPYKLEYGEGRAHLLLGQVCRVLTGEEETAAAMSITNLSGPAGRPIPLHYHEREHDVFYCTRGRIRVWADDQSRILNPGDIASVPPGVVHAYQTLDHYSEFLGPVVPSGWDRFFDFTGSPYEDVAYPRLDASPPPVEKFAQAEAKFRMTYMPDHPYAELTLDAPDDTLPGTESAYILRAGEGPRHELFGQVCFQLMTGAETGGRLAMTVTEGPRGPATPAHVHRSTHEGIYCLDGRMRVWLGGEEHELIRGDFVNVPAGVDHSHRFDADLTRFASMVAPAGIERLYELAGTVAEQRIFPAHAPAADPDRLATAAAELDIAFVD
jgi:quercetin dioxygenase-like cupin family protein